jgi:hypothetical protein
MNGTLSIGSALAWLVLLPGNLACDLVGIDKTEYRDLFRMLVNSLAWTVVGGVVVALMV